MAYSSFFAKAVLVVLFGSLITGQIIRFTVAGQGGGILLSDAATVLFLLVATLLFPFLPRVARQEAGRSGVVALVTIVPFLLWSVSTLILHNGGLKHSEILISLLYWIRLVSILLLYPAGMVMFRKVEIKKYAKKAFIYTYAGILILGFIQIVFYPSLEGIGAGWDPHMYRMVGTWLDPNFYGAFLAMSLPAIILWVPVKVIRTVFFVAGSVAILLTKSRSTYLAVVVGLCVCAIIWLFSASLSWQWKKMIVPALISLGIIVAFTGVVLEERAVQIFSHDPTVFVRLDSYKEVWKRLVAPNIFFGVGYNAYQFAAQDAGLISDYQVHSRGGSDSSILTLLVTTGIVGTALFFIPLLLGFIRHYSLLYVWATVFLLVHSLFINSLLYPHLLIPYILIVLLAL